MDEHLIAESDKQRQAFDVWYKDFVDNNVVVVSSQTRVVLPDIFQAWLAGQSYILKRIQEGKL